MEGSRCTLPGERDGQVDKFTQKQMLCGVHTVLCASEQMMCGRQQVSLDFPYASTYGRDKSAIFVFHQAIHKYIYKQPMVKLNKVVFS